jgi:hypothetical protein
LGGGMAGKKNTVKKTIFWSLYSIWFFMVITNWYTGAWSLEVIIAVIIQVIVIPLIIYLMAFRKELFSKAEEDNL